MNNTNEVDLSAFDDADTEPRVTDDYIEQLHIDIDEAWTVLARTRQEHHLASERAIQCKEVLDDCTSDFMLSGQATGKNSEEREARMDYLTRDARNTWRDACRKERTARFVLDAALDAVQQIKLQVALVGETK